MIQVLDERRDGISVSVFVPERQAGGTAKCSIHLKKKGQTQYMSIFELTPPYN